jgi:hypothetical protein
MATLTSDEQRLLEHFRQASLAGRSQIYNEAAHNIKVSGPLLVAYRTVMDAQRATPRADADTSSIATTPES